MSEAQFPAFHCGKAVTHIAPQQQVLRVLFGDLSGAFGVPAEVSSDHFWWPSPTGSTLIVAFFSSDTSHWIVPQPEGARANDYFRSSLVRLPQR
jgi:hypothetical protein